jgi:hypothetical protein
LDLHVSVYPVAVIHSNFGQGWSLDLIASSNSQVIPVDMDGDLEAGLFIQPFARFSLN